MFAGMSFTVFDAVATVANNINRSVQMEFTQIVNTYLTRALVHGALQQKEMKSHICPIVKTNLVIALHAQSLQFCKLINTTAYHLGRQEPSSPVSYCAPRQDLLKLAQPGRTVYLGSVDDVDQNCSHPMLMMHQVHKTKE